MPTNLMDRTAHRETPGDQCVRRSFASRSPEVCRRVRPYARYSSSMASA
ncbi:hypothetical protein ACFFX0_26630 [Citricoccus parietis]|uniref:DUF1534 domain-containing protein n=1 Tax=Citricoccus parietis TaxID=592307 RepID=A0ABV5G6P7_9MICC